MFLFKEDYADCIDFFRSNFKNTHRQSNFPFVLISAPMKLTFLLAINEVTEKMEKVVFVHLLGSYSDF